MATRSAETSTATSPDHVSGVLNYLADKEQRPVSYNFKPPEGVPARTGTYAKFTVPIYSARPVLGATVPRPPGLRRHASAVGSRKFLRR